MMELEFEIEWNIDGEYGVSIVRCIENSDGDYLEAATIKESEIDEVIEILELWKRGGLGEQSLREKMISDRLKVVVEEGGIRIVSDENIFIKGEEIDEVLSHLRGKKCLFEAWRKIDEILHLLYNGERAFAEILEEGDLSEECAEFIIDYMEWLGYLTKMVKEGKTYLRITDKGREYLKL